MNAAAAYGLETQARALCPLFHPSAATQDCHKFLVGTTSYSSENKIYVLDYQDEVKTLECSAVWFHDDEICSMWSSPSLSQKSLLAAVSRSRYRILQISQNLNSEPKEITRIEQSVKQILWDVDGLQNDFKSVSKGAITKVSLDASKLGAETACCAVPHEGINFACLDPHHPSLCVISARNDGLLLADFRSKKTTTVENSSNLHGFGEILSIDFNPSKPNEILTCGSDGYVLIHDIRANSKNALATRLFLNAHEHSVPKALFNPFHSELVISCSSDQSAKLWDTGKSSSCLKQLADFGDSVTDVCWSSSGPWVFAAVSYNGKVLVDNVPNETKMSILLDEDK